VRWTSESMLSFAMLYGLLKLRDMRVEGPYLKAACHKHGLADAERGRRGVKYSVYRARGQMTYCRRKALSTTQHNQLGKTVGKTF
jgi:hypothetical protein